MKIGSSWSVYRMKVSLSTGALAKKKQGYLLIELMITLAMIALCSFLVAQLQAHMAQQYYEAEQYLKAVNCANKVFEERLLGTQEQDGHTIKTIVQSVEGLAYMHVAVTVSWETGRGLSKNITIHGGVLNENESM